MNAKTPEQIALSILSEIVMLENNGTGMQKRDTIKKMTKPVYLDNQATTPVDPRVLKIYATLFISRNLAMYLEHSSYLWPRM